MSAAIVTVTGELVEIDGTAYSVYIRLDNGWLAAVRGLSAAQLSRLSKRLHERVTIEIRAEAEG